jgi:Family of unknown function (DUF6190)
MSSEPKTFFDASVFLGMNCVDEEIRNACKSFFASQFNGVLATSLEQVGRCDDVIWSYSRELQDAYYPFMDQLHSVMKICRQWFTRAELDRALSDARLEGLAIGDRLLLGKVIESGGNLYSVRPQLTCRDDLPVRKPANAAELHFPDKLTDLYRTSLQLRIPLEVLQG